MGRYLLRFSKTDRLKYISHLDLLRLFQRAFKRAGVQLKYSEGYNPHAKIAFAHPLSLGFESLSEYLDFETTVPYRPEQAAEMLREKMPPGLGILSCHPLVETSKTALAAAVDFASYRVTWKRPETGSGPDAWPDRAAFERMAQEVPVMMKETELLYEKFNRKKKKNMVSDVRPQMHSISAIVSDDHLTLSMMLRTGSRGNLNPEVPVELLCERCGLEYDRTEWDFCRTEMYFEEGRRLKPMTEFPG